MIPPMMHHVDTDSMASPSQAVPAAPAPGEVDGYGYRDEGKEPVPRQDESSGSDDVGVERYVDYSENVHEIRFPVNFGVNIIRRAPGFIVRTRCAVAPVFCNAAATFACSVSSDGMQRNAGPAPERQGGNLVTAATLSHTSLRPGKISSAARREHVAA